MTLFNKSDGPGIKKIVRILNFDAGGISDFTEADGQKRFT